MFTEVRAFYKLGLLDCFMLAFIRYWLQPIFWTCLWALRIFDLLQTFKVFIGNLWSIKDFRILCKLSQFNFWEVVTRFHAVTFLNFTPCSICKAKVRCWRFLNHEIPAIRFLKNSLIVRLCLVSLFKSLLYNFQSFFWLLYRNLSRFYKWTILVKVSLPMAL